MTRNNLISTWDEFVTSVRNRFGPSKYEDPQGALSKLLQIETVAHYQSEFEKLMNRVTDVSETLLISFYISGLKPAIQRELLISRPSTLGDAFALARITEARFGDQWATTTPSSSSTNTTLARQQGSPARSISAKGEPAQQALLPSPASKPIGNMPKPLPIKWISAAERQERMNLGLCFNCDNKWAKGHKCPGKFMLMMSSEEEHLDTGPSGATAEPDDSLETGDVSCLNSLVGHGSPRSLQLWGTISSTQVHVLIDNGSTHNFVQPSLIEQLKLPITPTKPFKVYIGSGATLLCDHVCAQVTLTLQGFTITVDLFVLPMQGAEVVLGIQWLQKLGKVTHDYAHQTMEFSVNNKKHMLKGDDALRFKKIGFHQMQALLDTDEIYGVYEIHKLQPDQAKDDVTTSKTATPIHPEIDALLDRYQELFAEPTSLPPHRVIDHRIHLFPDTKPVNVCPYRYPHYQKAKMEKLKDGNYYFCVDYRALNAMTVKDKFPIPTADEMFDELGGAIVFTKLDLRAGYHQIRVHDRDIYKTAFRTHDGHYEFLVMPFGLTNAPSTFQATMNRIFSPYLRKFVIVFFDDILIYSSSLTAHVEHLQCVFHCLQEYQFYVKRSKCVFGAASLEYLGHIISGQGVEMDPKKVEAVTTWPVPKTQKQVRSFLGLAGYYRRFIQGYASLAAPLSDLLQKDGFRWGEREHKAFVDLKHQLSIAPVLSLPDFEEVFVVETDASGDGIGAVLLQKGRPICFFSRKLGARMKMAATYQKELYAIVEAVYKWRQYLIGRRFLIRTDHKSIKELMQQVIQTPVQQQYVRKLMGFNFDIEYKPGTTNIVADALSRMHSEDDLEAAAFMSLTRPISGLLESLKEEHRTLEEVSVLIQRLQQGEVIEGFRVQDGLLIFQDRYYVGLQSKLKLPLLKEFHETRSAGHYKDTTRLTGGLLTLPDFLRRYGRALYGKLPPSLIPYPSGKSKLVALDDMLVERDMLIRHLKDNLAVARNRMETNANQKRREVEFSVEDKLESIESSLLPVDFEEAFPSEQPLSILLSKLWLSRGEANYLLQVLVQWTNSLRQKLPTWEGLREFKLAYPDFHLEDKVLFEEGGMIRSRQWRGQDVQEEYLLLPKWQQNFRDG
ncbi:ty3-gypsy retrotransposon protein [Tanacetum coccineum]